MIATPLPHAPFFLSDRSQLTKLNDGEGTHGAMFNADFSMFVDRYNDITTPTRTRLYTGCGCTLRDIDSGTFQAAHAQYLSHLSKPEFLQVQTRDGFAMEAMLIKPPDFDPTKKYPVIYYQYSGPAHPVVKNSAHRPFPSKSRNDLI
jgi:dipeptidyl-peptidase-4